MTPDNIKALEDGFPDIFDRLNIPDWPQDVIVVSDSATLDGPEDPFREPTHSEPSDRRFDEPPPELDDQVYSPDTGSERDPYRHPLGEIFGPGGLQVSWPGAPVIDGVLGGMHPPPDHYAFYLPWHYFPRHLWGIYLVVEGVEALGQDIYFASRFRLTLDEARYVAKTYLYHHEAYHNAVETFAARQEIAFRQPLYKSGISSIYLDLGLREKHEEALAEAYAAEKVRKHGFAGEKNTHIRRWKCQTAYVALCRLVRSSPPPYSFASPTLFNVKGLFPPAEDGFQELAIVRSIKPTVRGLPPSLWSAATHLMRPSLSRNGPFSYVVRHNHPLVARKGLQVRYCNRREFLKQLAAAVPGHLEAGGVHPIWVDHSTGKRVPIPTGSLPEGTANSILRDLGLKSKYRNWKTFLSADI